MKIQYLALFFFICASVNAQDSSKFRAGTAAVDISPDVFPMQLRSGASKYVHDPLHVRAVAFENGDGRVVIALMDAIGVGREMTDEAKLIAAKKNGLEAGTNARIRNPHSHCPERWRYFAGTNFL